jgi:hypothetical protein
MLGNWTSVRSITRRTLMENQEAKPKYRLAGRNVQAVEVLRRLDELGAIKLDVLLERSAEIQSVLESVDVEPGEICYPFYIRIGPRLDIDLVSVANELRQLGFEIKRGG